MLKMKCWDEDLIGWIVTIITLCIHMEPRLGGQVNNNDICRYATNCFERSFVENGKETR